MGDIAVTSRADQVAARQGLGPWEHTSRLNTRRRTKVLVNAVPVVVVGAGGLIWTFTIDGRGPTVALSILFGLLALVGLGLCVAAYRLLRVGHLLLHRFEHGFLVERQRGGLLCAPYTTVRAQVIDYDEPGDATSNPVPHVAVRFTFADDVLMVEEPGFGSPDALVQVAERCGRVERAPMPYLEAQRLLRAATWL